MRPENYYRGTHLGDVTHEYGPYNKAVWGQCPVCKATQWVAVRQDFGGKWYCEGEGNNGSGCKGSQYHSKYFIKGCVKSKEL